jgi:hypothetical protein
LGKTLMGVGNPPHPGPLPQGGEEEEGKSLGEFSFACCVLHVAY